MVENIPGIHTYNVVLHHALRIEIHDVGVKMINICLVIKTINYSIYSNHRKEEQGHVVPAPRSSQMAQWCATAVLLPEDWQLAADL